MLHFFLESNTNSALNTAHPEETERRQSSLKAIIRIIANESFNVKVNFHITIIPFII